jgi:molybdopterin/thiamine biosynthesis adenylyltransferase
MDITVKNLIDQLQKTNANALLLHCDNRMLISYFKDMAESLVYLQKLTETDTKYDWIQIETFMSGLIKQDAELTNIEINLEIQEIKSEKKTAKLTVKSY